MNLESLLRRFERQAEREAVVFDRASTSYEELLAEISSSGQVLSEKGIGAGSVVMLRGEYSPQSIAAFLAIVAKKGIVVPIAPGTVDRSDEFAATAEVEWIVDVDASGEIEATPTEKDAKHPIYRELEASAHPGLVLFSSGSTGESKAVVHDFSHLLEKFDVERRAYRTVPFLLFDHIGGINTLLHVLANGGCLVIVPDRTPEAVLRAIEEHRVELLPTSPTFLNLVLLSEAYRSFDLGSLRLVTYGTEPMPEVTLRRIREILPGARLQQTYGLSELGILRSKSESSDSLWVKVGGEGFETRIVDGCLEIRASSAMLGYLNAPNPFTEDGWFQTGDAVEQKGEFLRILGRDSEMINVGGEKVFPAEVENVIQELEEIAEATVFGTPNPITGQIVCAEVTPRGSVDPHELRRKVRLHCYDRLERFKAPAKIEVLDDVQHTERFKKARRPQ